MTPRQETKPGPRRALWDAGRFGVGFIIVGVFLLCQDVRGYARWPRREAQVVRHETGFGWTVPVYRVACYDGLDEVSGAKFGFLDGSPPSPGEIVTVACRPRSEEIRAVSASDYRAFLHRDVFFVLTGAVVGAAAFQRRRRRDEHRTTTHVARPAR